MTGRFTLRAVEPDADAPLLHRWVTDPKAAFWLMQDAQVDDVAREYARIAAAPAHAALLGCDRDGAPRFLMERYDPAQDPLGEVYDNAPGDVGMHVLTAPAEGPPEHGFTRAVMRAVMDDLFADGATRRVVVEPDVRNTAIHALNATVGFRVLGTVALPDKEALLSVCTREDYEEATR
jgi:RimJ/RimL family protein N-acetyltransferase